MKLAFTQGIAEMDSIVVCGPAFEAFTALGQLKAAGVSVSKVKHLAPAGPEPALSALLREAANQAGVTLPETIQVCLLPQNPPSLPFHSLLLICPLLT